MLLLPIGVFVAVVIHHLGIEGREVVEEAPSKTATAPIAGLGRQISSEVAVLASTPMQPGLDTRDLPGFIALAAHMAPVHGGGTTSRSGDRRDLLADTLAGIQARARPLVDPVGVDEVFLTASPA